MPKRLFLHMFFNRYFCQRSTIGAAVAPNPPFFNPFFLDVGLATSGADEHTFFV